MGLFHRKDVVDNVLLPRVEKTTREDRDNGIRENNMLDCNNAFVFAVTLSTPVVNWWRDEVGHVLVRNESGRGITSANQALLGISSKAYRVYF